MNFHVPQENLSLAMNVLARNYVAFIGAHAYNSFGKHAPRNVKIDFNFPVALINYLIQSVG